MKQRSLLQTLSVLATAGFAVLVMMPGCGGGNATDETGTGGSGGSASTTTTSETTETVNPACEVLCSHLADIDCNVLKNCPEDCKNHLNAPEDCFGEADALIDCWSQNLDEFMCTQTQALPPQACKDSEEALATCVGGGGPGTSCLCSPGVGGGDNVTNCTRKTTCGNLEYSQTCQKQEGTDAWTCTCLANSGLLGTCTEPDNFAHCSNDYGCCVPLFCAASSE